MVRRFTVMIPVDCTLDDGDSLTELWEALRDCGGIAEVWSGSGYEMRPERIRLKDMRNALNGLEKDHG